MSYQESGVISHIFTFYVKSFVKSYQFWIKCCKDNDSNILKKVHSVIEKSEHIIDETVTAIEDDIKGVVGSVFEKESRTQAVIQKNFGILVSTYKFNIIVLLLLSLASYFFYKKVQANIQKNSIQQPQSCHLVSSKSDSTQIGDKIKKDNNRKSEELSAKIKEIVHRLARSDSATICPTPKLTPEVKPFEPKLLKDESKRNNIDTSSICSGPETSKTESLASDVLMGPIKPTVVPVQEAIIKKRISLKEDKKSCKKNSKEMHNASNAFFDELNKASQETQGENSKKNKSSNVTNNQGHHQDLFPTELEEPTLGDALKEQKTLKNSSQKEEPIDIFGEQNLNQNKPQGLLNNNSLFEDKKISPKEDVYVFPAQNGNENSTRQAKTQGEKENNLLLDKTQSSEANNQSESVNSQNKDDPTSTTSSLSSTVDLKRGPKNSIFEALIDDMASY
uniref:t-SNARE coiled-coil homology domain-containing protein n=1 Tax=Strongyloides venezuelensis TaxID=75913 RepID=A0A0K0FB14_STRVS